MSGSCGCENSNCKCAESESGNDDMIKRILKRMNDAGYDFDYESIDFDEIPAVIIFKPNFYVDGVKGYFDISDSDAVYDGEHGYWLALNFHGNSSSNWALFKKKMEKIQDFQYKIVGALVNEGILEDEINPLIKGSINWEGLKDGHIFINDFDKPKTKSCSHDNLGIKTMEQLNGELLLTLVCDACGKRTSTSAPIESDDWDAESFEAEKGYRNYGGERWDKITRILVRDEDIDLGNGMNRTQSLKNIPTTSEVKKWLRVKRTKEWPGNGRNEYYYYWGLINPEYVKARKKGVKNAETYEATVVNKGKVPQGAIAKAMMNRAMITQVSIESVIQELENKVNLGLISEDELMKSLKKKFGAEYDIQVFNSRYGYDHIECGKCGGSHKGYCPDYGKEEDEYNQCTDCKWDGANGNWNTVIEWCSSCKEKNEIEAKRNAERIRLEKEREEQEERDFQESEKYSREQGDIWEDRYLAESERYEIKNKARYEKIVNRLWIEEGLTMTPDDWIGEKDGVQFNPPFYVKAPNGKIAKCQFKYDFYSDDFFVLGDYYDNIEYDENDVATGIPTIETMRDKLAAYGLHDLDFDAWNDINTLLNIRDFSDSKDDSCSHDDFEIEIIEKDGSDYLLTFKCLDCKKVGSTSAELQDNEWMD
jgi:hypothetical protein